MRSRAGLLVVPAFVSTTATFAQVIDTVLLSEVGRFQFPYWIFPDSSSYYTLSSRIDRLDRPYLYMASVEQGLVTLDISDPSTPVPVDTLLPADLGGLKVTNLEQGGELLYVCLGGFEGMGQTAGMATVDVSDPTDPSLVDLWSDPAFPNGSAIMKIDGDVAYLGAMEDGVIVLNVADPADIQFISSYQPDPTWPGIASYAPNGRGMAIVGDVLYLAFDAGGLRSLDISDPSAITQIGQYVNPNIPALTPPAYNNIVVIDGLAYCAIDFCGLEVIDVSDPANMTQVNWLNPWNCMGLSWFGSDGHTNEVVAAMGDSLLFVSGADSEILVYDITQASDPVLKGGHILPNDSAAAWGVDVHGNMVVGNFVNNHDLPLQPYDSKYGGVVLFDWTAEFSTGIAGRACQVKYPYLNAWPNPSRDLMDVSYWLYHAAPARLRLMDVHGRVLQEQQLPVAPGRVVLDLSTTAPGLYTITLSTRYEHLSILVVRAE